MIKTKNTILVKTLLCLSLLGQFGCDSDGNDNSGGGGNTEPPVPSTFSVGGTVYVEPAMVMDADVNDPLAPYSSNDSFEEAQDFDNHSSAGGYVNVAATGAAGRSQQSGDTSDFYRVSLDQSQSIVLSVANFEEADADLFLWNSDGTVFIDGSTNTGSIETLTPPDAGTYLLEVYAYSGASNYILSVNQQDHQANVQSLRLSDAFVPGEIVLRKDRTASRAGTGTKGASKTDFNRLSISLLAGSEDREQLYKLPGDGQVLGMAGLTAPAGQSLASQYIASADPVTQLKWETMLAIKQLRQRSDIEVAEPNYIVKPYAAPNDQFYSQQWHYDMVNLPDAWNITTGSNSVVVAVIDTGLLTYHPDMAGQVVPGYDFIRDPNNAMDGDGLDPDPADPGDSLTGGSSFHGTHVAGTIAAATNNLTGVAGVAWNSKIMPLRVLGYQGGTSYDIREAIKYAAGISNDSGTLPVQRADVINMSLGGAYPSTLDQELLNRVRSLGVIVIAAAGNNGAYEASYPAAYDGVVSVSAVGPGMQAASYTNFHPTVDVTAPGGDNNGAVYSATGNDQAGYIDYSYGYKMGTSMAAPHVAGIAALMKAVDPALNPARFDVLLQSGALTTDIGHVGHDDLYGYGLIDAYKAVSAVHNTPPGPDPQLAVLPGSLNFGFNSNSRTVQVENLGGGVIEVGEVHVDAAWLSVSASNVSNDGLGIYTVSVNRAGLGLGRYTATISFQSALNGQVSVPVSMDVRSASDHGDAGYHYILLIDVQSDSVSSVIEATANGGSYDFEFNNVASGDYKVIAGTDSNNDGQICDAGEACGAYSSLESPVSIYVDRNLNNIDFNTRFETEAVSQNKGTRQNQAAYGGDKANTPLVQY